MKITIIDKFYSPKGLPVGFSIKQFDTTDAILQELKDMYEEWVDENIRKGRVKSGTKD